MESRPPPSSHRAAPDVVLVIDDDQPTRLLIARWLIRNDYQVLEAPNGLEGVRIATSDADAISVIVLDVMMPGLDGFGVLRQLKDNPITAAIPVILLTAHANDDPDVVRGIETGAADHLAKPFRGPVMVARVSALARQRAEERNLHRRLAQAELAATTDPLTGLSNRRHFEECLIREASHAERHHQPLSLIAVDLDHFKSINDTYGHAGGDVVLKRFADTLRTTLRRSDEAFRIGGEEFAILLRGDKEAAVGATARLRRVFALSPVDLDEGELEIRFSAGVAVADSSNGFDTKRMLQRADEALYRAKEGGRDRSEVELPAIEPAASDVGDESSV